MSQITYEEAVEIINKYKDDTGKTQSAIAKELGVSSGALSAYISGSYKTPHTITLRVEGLVKIQEKRRIAPKEPPFTQTTISKMVMDAITYCHLQGKIAVIYGDAGIGKTEAVREYLRCNNLAIGITISPSYASMTGVNELIAEQLGVRERVARKIYAEIINKLRGSGRVLIIDEAQHLTVRTLNHLRCMSDESGVGIAFVGNDEVYTKMKGSGRADFAQLFSRIGMRKQVLTNNITLSDVENVFKEAFLEEEALELLYRIARTNYGLRGAVNVFVNTAAAFELIDAPNVARMTKEMNIGR